MTRRGRVLHLLGPSTGGIRAHVAALTGALEARGWAVTVAGPAGVLEGLRPLDHVVPVPAGLSPRGLLRARRALGEAAAEVDVVHAHGLKAGWVAARLRASRPVVLSVHNLVLDEVAGRSAPVLRVLEGLLLGRVDRVVAVSDEVARRFTGVAGAGRITVVPPLGPVPVPGRTRAEVRADLGVPAGTPLVVTAARLHPQKGLTDLVAAAERLRDELGALRWVVLGEGPLRPALEAEIAARRLGGVVQLAGARATVADELAAADVVAITSRWESGPLVVLEALALRRPVVATAVGLVPAVVGPGDGVVVPVEDPAALAAAVRDVLAGRAGRNPGGGAGGRYGPSALVPPIEALYQELLPPR